MGKDHKQLVLRADIYTWLFNIENVFNVIRSQINANLNKEVYTPYLTGKNHTNFELGKVDYKLIEYFWKAI